MLSFFVSYLFKHMVNDGKRIATAVNRSLQFLEINKKSQPSSLLGHYYNRKNLVCMLDIIDKLHILKLIYLFLDRFGKWSLYVYIVYVLRHLSFCRWYVDIILGWPLWDPCRKKQMHPYIISKFEWKFPPPQDLGWLLTI